jgi:hypothetical protein
MKRAWIFVALILIVLGPARIWADNITLDESQMVWPQTVRFVTGVLFMCESAPGSVFFGPCGDPPPSDILFFDNAKHEVVFISNGNDNDANPEPADVPFGGSLGAVINPRFVKEPTPVNGLSTLIWAPGPNDPGFYGAGNTWTIKSDAPEQAVPEPSSVALLASVLLLFLIAGCRYRRILV